MKKDSEEHLTLKRNAARLKFLERDTRLALAELKKELKAFSFSNLQTLEDYEVLRIALDKCRHALGKYHQ